MHNFDRKKIQQLAPDTRLKIGKGFGTFSNPDESWIDLMILETISDRLYKTKRHDMLNLNY